MSSLTIGIIGLCVMLVLMFLGMPIAFVFGVSGVVGMVCILGVNDQKKMEDYFGIPQGSEVRLVLAVGYSAEEKAPRKKIRKPVEEICSFNHW